MWVEPRGGHNIQLQLWPAIIKEGRGWWNLHSTQTHITQDSTNEPLNYQFQTGLINKTVIIKYFQNWLMDAYCISSKLIKSQTLRQDQDTRAPIPDTRQILVSGDFTPPFLVTLLLCRLVMSDLLRPYQSSQPSLNNETRYKIHNSLEVE